MRTVVIVGGGSAGWSAAVALSTLKDIDVTLVCGSESETIGVGESTLPFLDLFHRTYGIPSDTLMQRVNGTPKFTIEFKGFLKDTTWYHPFSRGYVEEISLARDIPQWMSTGQSLASFVRQTFRAQDLRDNQFYTELNTTNPPLYPNESGLHIDANLYGEYLKEVSLQNGVTYIDSTVSDVEVGAEGIERLVLSDGSVIAADLFIDCTGFKRLLISRLEGYSKVPIGDILKCDTALAVQLPYIDRSKQEVNATTCTALSSGWVWQVPLSNRVGIGYVHSSEFQCLGDAKEEFRDYLINVLGYERAAIDMREVPFDTGRLTDAWIGNTIAIGLSSGFIEPLESTGIALTHLAIMELVGLLNSTASIVNIRRRYNTHTSSIFDEIKTFIEFHYLLSDRDDSEFWRYVSSVPHGTEHAGILQTYTENYHEFRKGHTLREAQIDTCESTIFSPASYLLMLIGYGIFPVLAKE